jgi:hypothetical protein
MPARTYPVCRGGPSTERPTPRLAVGKRVAADPAIRDTPGHHPWSPGHVARTRCDGASGQPQPLKTNEPFGGSARI